MRKICGNRPANFLIHGQEEAKKKAGGRSGIDLMAEINPIPGIFTHKEIR